MDALVEETVVSVVDWFQQNTRQGLIQYLGAGGVGELPDDYMKRGAPDTLVLIDERMAKFATQNNMRLANSVAHDCGSHGDTDAVFLRGRLQGWD